ncbi:MAG TPA: M23 family metallopeptidase [Candidatus Sulfomarinibacteraceae bacterium]|nr:M23 family metallopeptidase [Candidatus Sulfomarinibacteraceae bacterium]
MIERRQLTYALLIVLGATVIVAVALVLQNLSGLAGPQSQGLRQWWRGDEATRKALVTVRRDTCPGAPFILPSDGFIGLLYADPRGPYSADNPHQGIDIFSDSAPGVTPVYAAYDGYVTREAGWKSTLIQRIPRDPLRPERQIWLYYTHMADESGENDFIQPPFAPGTRELFVEQGTLLGHTGNYSGSPVRTVWTHLHFSIVLDDGNGHYLNELEFSNTLDPSPYLGMAVHYDRAEDGAPIRCQPE